MSHIPKLAILSLALSLLVSCGLSDLIDSIFDEPDCSDRNKRYGFTGKIKFEEYWTGSASRDYTVKIAFHEGDSFSYLRIFHQDDKNDTVRILNGKFRTYRDRKYPWHILKLSSDSIYEKQIIKDTLNGKVYYSPDFVATKFLGFPDSLLTDVTSWNPSDSSWTVDSTCFKLNKKSWNDSNYCNDSYFPDFATTFCPKPPEEERQPNSTED